MRPAFSIDCQRIDNLHSNFLVAELGADELAVEASDMGEADGLGALSGARTGVGAVTEAEFVHLGNHRFGAGFRFYAALREESELRHLGSHE